MHRKAAQQHVPEKPSVAPAGEGLNFWMKRTTVLPARVFDRAALQMGAGGVLRWQNNTELWAKLDQVVGGIAKHQQPDGFAMAFNQADAHCKENPDYVTSWVTHGLLEAHAAGHPAGQLDSQHTDGRLAHGNDG